MFFCKTWSTASIKSLNVLSETGERFALPEKLFLGWDWNKSMVWEGGRPFCLFLGASKWVTFVLYSTLKVLPACTYCSTIIITSYNKMPDKVSWCIIFLQNVLGRLRIWLQEWWGEIWFLLPCSPWIFTTKWISSCKLNDLIQHQAVILLKWLLVLRISLLHGW